MPSDSRRVRLPHVGPWLHVGLLAAVGCTGKADSSGPGARYNAAGGLDRDGEVLHLVGGADATGMLSDAWALDIPHRQWVRVDGPSDPLLSTAAARLDDTIWLAGGTGAGRTETDALVAWQTRGGTWTEATPGDVRPSARREATLTRLGETQAVLVGGNTDDSGDPGTTLADVWGLDATGPTWTEVETFDGPAGLQRHAAAFDGERVWIHGGVDADGTLSSALWSLDTTSWSWSRMEPDGPSPSARADHLLAAWDDRLVLFGGDLDDPDLWIYSVTDGTWSVTAGPGPAPRDAFLWDTVDGQPWVVLCGGDTGGTYESDVWVLHLDALEWTELLQFDNTSF